MRLSGKLLLIITAVCSAFTACSSEGFAVSSSSLRCETICEVDENGGAYTVSSYLHFRAALTPDDSYSFELSDPSGLVWSGPLVKNGDGFYSSDELALSDGAAFAQGSYSYTVTSSRGEMEEGRAVFHQEDVIPPYVSSEGILVSDGECTIVTASGEVTASGGDAVTLTGEVRIREKDAWSNEVTAIQNLT